MSYIRPSVLVYQDLLNSGGVLNSVPDLECAIIGPAYNKLGYSPTSLASKIATAAHSTSSTLGTINVTSSAYNITVVSTAGFMVGDILLVEGAGIAGAMFQATVLTIVGNVITVDTAANVSVIGAKVTKTGAITNSAQTNSFVISGAKAGQILDVTSINVWLDSVKVETVTQEVCTATTGAGVTTNNVLNVTTIDTSNINTTTNTLRASPGDSVLVQYGTGFTSSFTSTILSMTTTTALTSGVVSSDLNGYLNSITLIDNMPSNYVSGVSVKVSIRKSYNDQLLASSNYVTTTTATDGVVTINTNPTLVYGKVISAKVYISYKALRTDLAGQVLTINNVTDLEGQLGDISQDNPLALGCQIALANTVGRVRAIAVASNDLTGYEQALTASEGERLYFLAPLTQDVSILAAFKAHVIQMSTPVNAAWRTALVNTAMQTVQNIGQYSSSFMNTNSANAVTSISGNYVLTAPTATFISDGVVPGDIVNYGGGIHTVTTLISNQQIGINATAAASSVSYYITRAMSKTQTATEVALTSKTFGSNRVWHIQPDTVGVSINGVVTYLPGYYLACGLAGMGAGFPVQQGFTNIGVAGISDLKNSNFYFSKDDINAMAETGTCLFVQDTQGGMPYCRHELTTDISVLEYREILVVKNWDFLSYFYYDKLKSFIGSWNITPDTINTIRSTIIASSELVKGQKLPRIGAPLLKYDIQKLEQNPYNKDNLDVILGIGIVYPLNYLNLHLVI